MYNHKLREVYDKSYQETFNQILDVVPDREEAKSILGQIYREAADHITKSSKTIDDIKFIFENAKLKYGISALA